MNYERLGKLAERLATNDKSALDALSTSERIYVCIAANKAEFLQDNLAYSIGRLGEVALAHLVQRHQCD